MSTSSIGFGRDTHKRLKVIRVLLFAFLLYDNINDIQVYNSMLVAVSYHQFQDPCAPVNDRGQFEAKFGQSWNNFDTDFSVMPDVMCDPDRSYSNNCHSTGYTNFSQYLQLMDVFWSQVGYVIPEFQENIDVFKSLCNDIYVVDGSIHECSFSNKTHVIGDWVEPEPQTQPHSHTEGCYRTRNVQKEKNEAFKPFILASIAIVAVKELLKACYVIFIWLSAPSRPLGPNELSVIGETPFLLLLVWRRPKFIRELITTKRTMATHLQILVVEDIVESTNQLLLVIFYALRVNMEGIAYGIMFSLAASACKILMTIYNILDAWTVNTRKHNSNVAAIQPEGDDHKGEVRVGEID